MFYDLTILLIFPLKRNVSHGKKTWNNWKHLLLSRSRMWPTGTCTVDCQKTRRERQCPVRGGSLGNINRCPSCFRRARSTLCKTKSQQHSYQGVFLDSSGILARTEETGKNYYYYCVVVIIIGDESFIKNLMYARQALNTLLEYLLVTRAAWSFNLKNIIYLFCVYAHTFVEVKG